jgi:diguanylate cyclase (GGDEF)-like protein
MIPGHKAGDEALVQLADLARWSCRRGDVVLRYGGDEFPFILSKADLRAALTRDRFRAKVASSAPAPKRTSDDHERVSRNSIG